MTLPDEIGEFWQQGKATWPFSEIIYAAEDIHKVVSWMFDEPILPSPTGKIREWDETGEMATYEALNGMLATAGVPDFLISKITAYAKQLSPNISPLRTAYALGLLAITTVATLGAPLSAITKSIAMGINRETLDERPDLLSLIMHSWRTGETEILEDYSADLGFGPVARSVMTDAMRPILTMGELQEAYRRNLYNYSIIDFSGPAGNIPVTDYDKIFKDGFFPYAKQLGYKEDDARQIFAQTNQLMPRGEIDELLRRGEVTDNYWNHVYARQGFDNSQRYDLHKLVTPLMGIGDIINHFHRGKYTSWNEAVQEIMQHGFDENRSNKILESGDRLHDPISLTVAYHRELLTKDEYIYKLMSLGYTEEDSLLYEKSTWLLPAPSDLVRFGVREVYTPDVRIRFRMDEDFPEDMAAEGSKIGYTRKVMEDYWAAHWMLPNPTQGFEMLHRQIINYDDMKMLLRALDVMPFWQDKMIQLSYSLIPRRALGKLVKQDILKEADIMLHYQSLGYSPENARKFTESAIMSAAEPERDMTKADILDAYRIDQLTIKDSIKNLYDLGYNKQAVDYYIAKANLRKEKDKEAEQAESTKDEAKKARELTKTEVLKAYRRGLFPRSEAFRYLTDLGFADETAEHLLTFEDLRRIGDDLETKGKYVKQLFDAELITIHEARQKLTNAGYIVDESKRLLDLWELEHEIDKQLAAQRLRNPTRTDLNNWLLKGVIDSDQWNKRMAELGYSDEDITSYLIELLIDRGE